MLSSTTTLREHYRWVIVAAGGLLGCVAIGALFSLPVLLRPIEGVKRGAIATVIPTQHNEFVLLDAGANIECRPLHLAQFAIMGSVYAREILGYDRPRVGVATNARCRPLGESASCANEATGAGLNVASGGGATSNRSVAAGAVGHDR